MKKHVKIYYKYFELDICDTPLCEVCNDVAVDIHHIDCKGMGGSKNKDFIENLQALCRDCHLKFGDKKQYKEMLTNIHLKKNKRGRL